MLLLVPGLVAISLLILAAALQLAALLIPSGAILFILGLRIAYNHRRARRCLPAGHAVERAPVSFTGSGDEANA
ncbi:MAG: hypothetical protein E6G33_01875 [Actinobacteria bacterium]|nr:MAG: hypothetical protein E6G33_01875 [Actinomycetota bacterium]